MASLRRKAQQAAPRDAEPTLPLVHDDQLDADDMTSIGMFLLSRRESGATIADPDDLFPVYSMDDVYGIHSGTVAHPPVTPLALTKTSSMLGNHVGWKCGACSSAAQAGMGLSEPFRAPLFQDRIFTEQRTSIDLGRTNLTLLEAEFGLVLSKSLPPRGTPYTAADVMGAVSVVIPSVEVCATRWSNAAFEQSTPFHRLADGGGNDSCITGEAFDATGVLPRLQDVEVRFLINGDVVDAVSASSGSGADVLGHPANALAWLANSLIEGQTSTEASSYGGGSVVGLQAGDFVMSGAAAVLPATALQPGDTVVAEFEGLGSVQLVIRKEEPVSSSVEADDGRSEARVERMSNEAWRDLCAQAREPGTDNKPAMKLPMIYPWSPAREAAVRQALSSTTMRTNL